MDIYPPKESGRPVREAFEDYKKKYEKSLREPDTFWAEESKNYLTWFSEPLSISSGTFHEGDINWFAGGKLNVCYNCVDRHLQKRADQVRYNKTPIRYETIS